MTDDEAEALVNEVIGEGGFSPQLTIYRSTATFKALCRAIKQHEAFKQEVSDAAQEYEEAGYCMGWEGFERFIIPQPKPDPLVEAMADCGVDRFESWADQLRAALDAAGFEIREKSDD